MARPGNDRFFPNWTRMDRDFYISQTAYPIPDIGAWNMVVGFAFIGVGFSLATRWR